MSIAIKDVLLAAGLKSEEVDAVIDKVNSAVVIKVLDKSLEALPSSAKERMATLKPEELPAFIKENLNYIAKPTQEDIKSAAEEIWLQYFNALVPEK